MVGDQFLRNNKDALFQLRWSGMQCNPRSVPYMFQEFNISTYYVTSEISNIITRFMNAFVEALNEKPKLPKFVIVIPDSDILSKFAA